MSERRVLIVDDEPVLVELVTQTLGRDRYRFDATATAAGAMELLEDGFRGVVLLDLHLPDAEGIDLIDRMMETYDGIRVVIMTAHSSAVVVADAIRRGAYDFLDKGAEFKARVTVSVHNAFKDLAMSSRLLDMTLAAPVRELFAGIIASSEPMLELFSTLSHVMDSRVTVLLMGDSGTGKELVARRIHQGGARADGPFIAINCAGIPENLLESELFGHERGAFTGAVSSKRGKFELAHGGTIFLDEIGEMPMALQPKILRALESRRIERVGGEREIELDVRIISATHRDLTQMVEQGDFREDLFYRLSVFPIRLPRLADRVGDVPLLAHHFMRVTSEEESKDVQGFTSAAMEALEAHDYPGNVRELENIVSRAVILASGPQIALRELPRVLVEHARDLGLGFPDQVGKQDRDSGDAWLTPAFERLFQSADHLVRAEILEDALIRRGLELVGGNVTQLSRLLGLSRATLYRRLSPSKSKRELID